MPKLLWSITRRLAVPCQARAGIGRLSNRTVQDVFPDALHWCSSLDRDFNLRRDFDLCAGSLCASRASWGCSSNKRLHAAKPIVARVGRAAERTGHRRPAVDRRTGPNRPRQMAVVTEHGQIAQRLALALKRREGATTPRPPQPQRRQADAPPSCRVHMLSASGHFTDPGGTRFIATRGPSVGLSTLMLHSEELAVQPPFRGGHSTRSAPKAPFKGHGCANEKRPPRRVPWCCGGLRGRSIISGPNPRAALISVKVLQPVTCRFAPNLPTAFMAPKGRARGAAFGRSISTMP